MKLLVISFISKLYARVNIFKYVIILTINKKVRDENLQCHINREVVQISALWLGKIDKYEYLMGKAILASVPSQINQQAKFTKSILAKAFKKQTKMIMDQGDKQIEAAVK